MKKYEKINNYENLRKFMCPMSGCIIIDDHLFNENLKEEIFDFLSNNNEFLFTHFKDDEFEENNHYSLIHIDDFLSLQ